MNINDIIYRITVNSLLLFVVVLKVLLLLLLLFGLVFFGGILEHRSVNLLQETKGGIGMAYLLLPLYNPVGWYKGMSVERVMRQFRQPFCSRKRNFGDGVPDF